MRNAFSMVLTIHKTNHIFPVVLYEYSVKDEDKMASLT